MRATLRSMLAAARLVTPAVAAAPPRPNVVVVFIDDLGYADIGPFGATKQKTPNLDRMAAEGMKLTSFYAAPGLLGLPGPAPHRVLRGPGGGGCPGRPARPGPRGSQRGGPRRGGGAGPSREHQRGGGRRHPRQRQVDESDVALGSHGASSRSRQRLTGS